MSRCPPCRCVRFAGLSERVRRRPPPDHHAGEAANGKAALCGVITSVVALVLATIGMVIFFTAPSDLGDDLDEISTDLDNYTECVDAIPADAPDFAEQMDACDDATQ